jgi:hypothetical protein
MPGRVRLPGGEARKASQRRAQPAKAVPVRVGPTWRPGDRVQWKGRDGIFRRDVGDGDHAEVTIGERVYRVRIAEIG